MSSVIADPKSEEATSKLDGDGASNQAENGRRDTIALQEILMVDPTLYVNLVGEPMIGLPIGGDQDARRPCRLRSERARSELYLFIQKATGFIPYEHEINRLIWVLSGIAWQSQTNEMGLLDAMDQDPVLEALHYYLTQPDATGKFDDTCSLLEKELRKAAETCGISTSQKAWPKGAPQLSQRLAELHSKGVLARFRIDFERPEHARPRAIKLSRIAAFDDGVEPPSDQRRDDNSNATKEVTSADGDDGAVPDVFARIAAPSEEN